MEKLTYKQAFDKITEAYIKGEIRPVDPCFCFCGTLCNNTQSWFKYPTYMHKDSHGYKGEDFVKMETALFKRLYIFNEYGWTVKPDHPATFEQDLFDGMSDALEVLKQIHKERGENVEDFQFTKRQNLNLCTQK